MKSMLMTFSVLVLVSCASILSKSVYPIHITSSPTPAKVTITDLNGMEVYNGEVPTVVKLEASAKFFKKQQYSLTFSAPGYEDKTIPLLCKVDGWYWGNLILGGVIGMLIVDPATGAMYKFHQESISTTLRNSDSSALIIRSVRDLSWSQRSKLELIGQMEPF